LFKRGSGFLESIADSQLIYKIRFKLFVQEHKNLEINSKYDQGTYKRLLQFLACTNTTADPPKVSEGFSNKCSYGPTTTQQQRYYNVLQDLIFQFTA
jgi:hypothetical protein